MTSDNEIWRPVCGHSGYEVSNQGRIRSWRKQWSGGDGRVLKLHADNNGYSRVSLGRGSCAHVHVLVAEAFVGPRSGECCRHLNEDPSDNRPENLAWGTRAENAADAVRHGRHQRGSRSKRAKLDDQSIALARSMLASGATRKSVATLLGVSKTLVAMVARGERKTDSEWLLDQADENPR